MLAESIRNLVKSVSSLQFTHGFFADSLMNQREKSIIVPLLVEERGFLELDLKNLYVERSTLYHLCDENNPDETAEYFKQHNICLDKIRKTKSRIAAINSILYKVKKQVSEHTRSFSSAYYE